MGEQPIVHENAAHFVPPPISMELPNINNTSGSHAVPLPGPSSNSVKVPPPLPGPHLLVPDVLVSEHTSPPQQRPPVLSQVPLIVKSEPQEYLMQPQPSTTISSQTESSSPNNSSKRNRNNNNVIESLDTDTGSVNDEERKKELRRLRNKEAAARCRKRRLDQTVTLQTEVDKLEDVKRELRQE